MDVRLQRPAAQQRCGTRRHGERIVPFLLLATLLLLATGCFEDGPQAVARLRAEAGDRLNIGVNEDGWFVSVGGDEFVQVTEQIAVEASAPELLVVWHNDDDRYHEIMYEQSYTADDAIHINPGERVERWIELDFERHIHSHNAPELAELHVRVERTAGR